MRNQSRIEAHPRFADFMRIFDAMRISGPVRYQKLTKSIRNIDPSIPSYSVYHYFRKFTDSYILKKEIRREELRHKRKAISNEALDEVMKNPSKLDLKTRINIGRDAVNEELKEIGMILNEKHKQKEESMLEKLLDAARYGEQEPIEAEFHRPGSLLDKKVASYESVLPDTVSPESVQSVQGIERRPEENS